MTALILRKSPIFHAKPDGPARIAPGRTRHGTHLASPPPAATTPPAIPRGTRVRRSADGPRRAACPGPAATRLGPQRPSVPRAEPSFSLRRQTQGSRSRRPGIGDIRTFFKLGRTAQPTSWRTAHPVPVSPRCYRWWASEVEAFADGLRRRPDQSAVEVPKTCTSRFRRIVNGGAADTNPLGRIFPSPRGKHWRASNYGRQIPVISAAARLLAGVR